MPPNRQSLRAALKEFDFTTLFIEELGWDRPPTGTVDLLVDGVTYSLSPVAHKRGMVVLIYATPADQTIPDHATRSKIERQATKVAHEHIIIYLDSERTTQVWQWVRRQPGQPSASRHHSFHRSQPGDALLQRIEGLAFELAEEESLTIATVANRARQAFDVERVTRRFYDQFKSEHTDFLAFVKGIQSQGDRDWYASLMLNRLMFVYFIQKKGFLDGDIHYLRNRLRQMQARRGKDKFLSFYRHFLLRLFHEGLGQHASDPGIDELLGRVPYLNGGLFDVHELERANTEIEIPDEAFEKLFDFFDAYQWHLDERPLQADNEINPDVLGYIFEKYINQKEMGAYYTKEDITEYIAKTTIVPHVIDVLQREHPGFADDTEAVWSLVTDDPDRYIYDAVLKGLDHPLPAEILAGVADVERRGTWNRPADADFALPTETWREHVERRTRCESLRAELKSGAVATVDDFVGRNLDLRQFAQDIVERSESPALIATLYSAIRSIAILDPTCGSGAFLFAAVNVLEPLYEACLERMQVFVDDWDRQGESTQTELRLTFTDALEELKRHTNHRYFILKSIILNNLYGVDIMEEAVEICKLRLFLKLAAQTETFDDLEPLPDIDFNIRPGNTLVGFASYDEVAGAVGSRLDFDGSMARIDKAAADADEAFQRFRHAQTSSDAGSDEITERKAELRDRLAALGDELDGYLAIEYGATDRGAWRESHQPFHWFLDFYGVIKRGGFDVIIGNPPYVRYQTVRGTYSVRDFATLACGDLYALVMERAVALLRPDGQLGMITPVSITGTDGFQPLRDLLLSTSDRTYIQAFAERPSKLFTGVEKRLAIWISKKGTGSGTVFTSRYRRWLSDEREHLFATATLADVSDVPSLVRGSIPKVHTPQEVSVLRKLGATKKKLAVSLVSSGGHIVYYTRKVRYFVQFFLTIPRMLNRSGAVVDPTELKTLLLPDPAGQAVAVAALNSNLFFWFFSAYSDVRNVNRREIEAFPLDLAEAERLSGSALEALASELMEDFDQNSTMTEINYAQHGVLTIQVFQPRKAKPIIDRIDRELSKVYGLTAEEADFIVNHDIKYRLGVGADDAEEASSEA